MMRQPIRTTQAGDEPRADAVRGNAPRTLPARALAVPVLVVEDEGIIAWMLECLLDDMGFRDIRLASNGEEALALAERARPGLILSDINLASEPDGVDTARRIVAESPVPVIFVSAYADAATRARIEAEVAGARVLRKPVMPAELHAAITDVLEGDC